MTNQPASLAGSTRKRSPLLIGLYISHGVLQALDAQSTTRALHTGSAQEGNPLVRPFATEPAALGAFKLGTTALAIAAIDRAYKHHSRLAVISLAAINGAYAYLVQRSYRSFPRAEQTRNLADDLGSLH